MQILAILKSNFWDSTKGLSRTFRRLLKKENLCQQYKKMASGENKETESACNSEEQEVTIEKVVAKDNKGIDYDKLISKYLISCLRMKV